MSEIESTLKVIISQLDGINSNMDKRFSEQSQIIDLKLENQKQAILTDLNDKSKKLAQKTIDDTLKSIGINTEDFSKMQKDLIFLRWLRTLCTNSFTKFVMAIGGILGVTGIVGWLESKGFSVK